MVIVSTDIFVTEDVLVRYTGKRHITRFIV